MGRSLFALSLVGASLLGGAGAAHAQSYGYTNESPAPPVEVQRYDDGGSYAVDVYAPVAPPAPRVEVRPPAPSGAHVWCDGHWGWNGASWAWNAGRWALPPSASVRWSPATWTNVGGRWRFVDGGWRGGGYGYGYGYGGGYGHGYGYGYGCGRPGYGYGARPYGSVWVPGRWVWRGQWVWMPGHWSHRGW